MSKICPHCQMAVENKALTFCPHCNKSLVGASTSKQEYIPPTGILSCPDCGHDMAASAACCPHCGSRTFQKNEEWKRASLSSTRKVAKCPDCGQEFSFNITVVQERDGLYPKCPNCGSLAYRQGKINDQLGCTVLWMVITFIIIWIIKEYVN